MMAFIGRREFISLVGGAAVALPLTAGAQPQPKMLRVGFVGIQPRESTLYAAFLERMAELGYQEGRNFTFEYIQAANVDDYEKNYRELAARRVDAFLAVGNEPALRAALSAAVLRADHRRNGRGHRVQLAVRGDRHRRLVSLAHAGKGAQRSHVARPQFPPIGQRWRKSRPDLVSAQEYQSVPGAACKRLLQPQAVLGLQSRRFPLRLQRLREHQ